MRKIRARGIAYRSKALDAIAQDHDQFELISHLVPVARRRADCSRNRKGGSSVFKVRSKRFKQ